MSQHPESDTSLRQSSENGSEALDEERCSRRDLRLVTTLLVLGEEETLRNDVLGQDLEDHVGQRLSGQCLAADELREDVELISINVGDTMYNAAGDFVNRRNEQMSRRLRTSIS